MENGQQVRTTREIIKMQAYEVKGAKKQGWDWEVDFNGNTYSLAIDSEDSALNNKNCQVFNDGECLVWVDDNGNVLDADYRN